jgi:CRP/FNR family transcriptional regulator
VQTNSQVAQKVLLNFAQNLRMFVRMVSEMAFYQVTNRLARLISENEGVASGPTLTHEQLAARLGTVREVVSRSLKELERSGAIRVEDRRIRVVDRKALAQWIQPCD